MREHWTEARVEAELRKFVDSFDRMPTSTELHALGRDSLGAAVQRYGPRTWRGWSARLGTTLADSRLRFGLDNENVISGLMREMGLTVEAQRFKEEYDFLVNGVVRVEAKGAHWRSYTMPRGGICAGYFCNLTKGMRPHRCDVYAIRCCNGVLAGSVYYIPAARLRSTITVTPSGKYSEFRDNPEALLSAVRSAA